MASHRRIVNITNGYRMKLGQAERAILNCSAEWVEFGVTVRSLTLDESIKARNAQAAVREPLAYAEIPGLRYEPPVSGQNAANQSRRLVRDAHEFVLVGI